MNKKNTVYSKKIQNIVKKNGFQMESYQTFLGFYTKLDFHLENIGKFSITFTANDDSLKSLVVNIRRQNAAYSAEELTQEIMEMAKFKKIPLTTEQAKADYHQQKVMLEQLASEIEEEMTCNSVTACMDVTIPFSEEQIQKLQELCYIDPTLSFHEIQNEDVVKGVQCLINTTKNEYTFEITCVKDLEINGDIWWHKGNYYVAKSQEFEGDIDADTDNFGVGHISDEDLADCFIITDMPPEAIKAAWRCGSELIQNMVSDYVKETKELLREEKNGEFRI